MSNRGIQRRLEALESTVSTVVVRCPQCGAVDSPGLAFRGVTDGGEDICIHCGSPHARPDGPVKLYSAPWIIEAEREL